MLGDSPCPPGHDPTASIKTSAPASFKRLLDGGENSSAERPWEGNWDKEAFGIEVVLAGLVDDAQLPVTSSFPVRQDLVALVPQTEHQLPSRSRHISQDNA